LGVKKVINYYLKRKYLRFKLRFRKPPDPSENPWCLRVWIAQPLPMPHKPILINPWVYPYPRTSLQINNRCVCAEAFLLCKDGRTRKHFVHWVMFHKELSSDIRLLFCDCESKLTLRQSFIKRVEDWCGNSVVVSNPNHCWTLKRAKTVIFTCFFTLFWSDFHLKKEWKSLQNGWKSMSEFSDTFW
jgi:hypothetical protein